MLKLSNKGIYGIKALYELARNYGGTPLSIKEISLRHGMPVPFLEQVLHQLKNSGIVASHRGPAGGYELSRKPEDITIGDAVRALEGPIALCDCLQQGKDIEDTMNCVTFGLYRKLGLILEKAFDSVTLYELAKENFEGKTIIGCNIKQ